MVAMMDFSTLIPECIAGYIQISTMNLTVLKVEMLGKILKVDGLVDECQKQ